MPTGTTDALAESDPRVRPLAVALPRLLSLAEVAEALVVHPKTVRRLIAAGTLPATRAGRGLRIAERDLEAYLARNRVRPGAGR